MGGGERRGSRQRGVKKKEEKEKKKGRAEVELPNLCRLFTRLAQVRVFEKSVEQKKVSWFAVHYVFRGG